MNKYDLWLERRKERSACIALLEAERDGLYRSEGIIQKSNPRGALSIGYAADAFRDAVDALKKRDAEDVDPRLVDAYWPVAAR